MKGRLLLVRHGQSEGNAERRFTRSPEVPITELGRAQAAQTAALIRTSFAPVRVVASPFRRAQQTAEIIADVLGLPVDTEHDVREQHLGDLHGQPYEALAGTEGYGNARDWNWRPPGALAETLVEVQRRAARVIEKLARHHPAEDVVVVSHAGTTRAVWAHVERSWDGAESVPNCSLLVVPHDGECFGEPELKLAADAARRGPPVGS